MFSYFYTLSILLGRPLDEMTKVPECGFKVIKFVLQSGYYVQFCTNTLGNRMRLLNPPVMG